MNEETYKAIASQLRHPSGDYAIQIGEKMNEGNLYINLETIKALKLNAGDELLEIGMGNGFFVKDIFAAEASVQYDGCDFSAEMIAECVKNNKELIAGRQANFHHASADALPFSDNSFDKVLSVNTIYFWDNHEKILAEIRRVLRPGGRLILSLRPKATMQHYPFSKYGFVMFTKGEVQELLAKNNFPVEEIIEKDEPDQEINGEKVSVQMLIISAKNDG